MNSAHLTSGSNRTCKTVTRFAKHPAKQAPFLQAVVPGVKCTMIIWQLTTTLLLSFVASASEICAPIEASPETEQGKVLYAKYREKGLHLHSFPTWSGEGFYSVGSNEKYNFAISEIYWGSEVVN